MIGDFFFNNDWLIRPVMKDLDDTDPDPGGRKYADPATDTQLTGSQDQLL